MATLKRSTLPLNWQWFVIGSWANDRCGYLPSNAAILAIFGMMNIHRHLLPRWNGLPLLALCLPLAAFLAHAITPLEISDQAFIGLWILTCAMFAGLGHLIQSDTRLAAKSAMSIPGK